MMASDVARQLGYTNPQKAIRDHIDEEDKRAERIVHPLGGEQKMTVINESGLYSLILSSKLPQAKEFKRWVTSEVLPQIRMTGGYIPVSKDDDVDAIQRKAIDIMNRTIERMRAKTVLALADEIIGKELSETNRDAEDTLTATQVAKSFNMTVFNFNAVLRDLGIQYRRHGHWNISDDLADRDFVRMRTHVSYSLKGRKKVRTYMTWTMSGLHYLNARLGYPNF